MVYSYICLGPYHRYNRIPTEVVGQYTRLSLGSVHVSHRQNTVFSVHTETPINYLLSQKPASFLLLFSSLSSMRTLASNLRVVQTNPAVQRLGALRKEADWNGSKKLLSDLTARMDLIRM